MKSMNASFRSLAGGGAWGVGEGKRKFSPLRGHRGSRNPDTTGRLQPTCVSAVREPFEIILKLFSFLP